MKQFIALLLTPALAHAGVVYDMAVRPVDQSNIAGQSPDSPAASAVVARYFVDDGQVRVGGPDAKTFYVFKDRTMEVIDNPARAYAFAQPAG